MGRRHHNGRNPFGLGLALAAVVLVAACALAEPGTTPTATGSTGDGAPAEPTAGPLDRGDETGTPVGPASPSPAPTRTPTPSPMPTSTPTPTPTPTPTLTPTPSPLPTPASDLLVAAPGTVWNFELVGHHALGSIGWHGNLALNERCAYVGSWLRPEINILDVSSPANPVVLDNVALPAGAKPAELRALPARDLLVVADISGNGRLLTYDIGDCAVPEPLATFRLAQPCHEFYLWDGGEQVLVYAATLGHFPPKLLVVDLTDPTAPREVARWTGTDEGIRGIAHSVSISDDGRRGYLAMWDGGLAVLRIDLPQIDAILTAEGDWNPIRFPNTHSAVALANPDLILLAGELYNCPFAGLAVVDISQPGRPEIIGRFELPENSCQDLPGPRGGTFTPHNPLVVGDMALVTWYAAGLQAVDLSDPTAPRRLGQFVPPADDAAGGGLLGSYPVQSISYPIVRDGLIYFADMQSGLYVVRYTGERADWLAAVARAEGNVNLP